MKKIEIIDEKTLLVDGETFRRDDVSTAFDVPESTPTPQFKIGDWVMTDRNTIFRIGSIHEWNYDGDVNDTSHHTSWRRNSLRLATKEEIESHLKKVAEGRGYKRGVKVRCVTYPERNDFILTGDFEYGNDLDRLVDENAKNEDDEYPSIYDNGKWATIIPQKKSLPKTKDELRDLFFYFIGMDDVTKDEDDKVNELLNQYED